MPNNIQLQLDNNQIYLDANATTAVLPQIAEVVSHAMKVCFGNPSSSHITGIKAKHLMEQTRLLAKTVIGAKTGQVLFTSGATEGIQTAIVSALLSQKNHSIKKPVLLYGATEHKAVPNTLKHWNAVLEINAEILAIPVNPDGLLDLTFIAEHVPNALMICTMAVNNETGVFQDLEKLEHAIRNNNSTVAWMVDCVQALGKTSLKLSDTSIDYAPFSGHKLYAPKGIGFLYIRENSAYTPFIAGGGQESGMRSGTENLPGIAGLNCLFNLLLDEQQTVFKSYSQLLAYREQLSQVLQFVFPEIVFNHDFNKSVPTTINFAVKNVSSKEIMDLFDAAGIRVSAGSACSSGASRSYVLDAMSVPNWQSENAIRLSFGPAATQIEIDLACKRISQLKSVLASACLIVSDREPLGDKEVCSLGLSQFRHQGACSWLFVTDEKQAVVIDPVLELMPRLINVIQGQKLELVAVLASHQHPEQESMIELFYQMAQLEPLAAMNHLGWPVGVQSLRLGQYELSAIATPGHISDSVSYLLKNNGVTELCFCGDLILTGGLGRTNLEQGDAGIMYQSIQALSEQVTANTLMCSSHDYSQSFATDWQTQIRTNHLLEQVVNGIITQNDFITQKVKIDETLAQQNEYFCGAVLNVATDPLIEQSLEDAIEMVSDNVAVLIDIRESYEHNASLPQKMFGINASQVINIPLNRISDAIWQGKLSKNQSYVLLCRSGNRSRQACLNLKQLGFEHVFNIKGGMALA
ncbi:aminotransferase class V-fold PLP-dependent enzyme [Pseudoalteromonas tunicata]|jgi:cysteine sulfinate desulfinase/cysteine desulfurase-like protein/glyoxylase-like metal-dependent hydrolase (beta-lactamase superfamily II)/rhodanese-related sulfurtransferase|uniref:cysteine desulfurase n=1 Tax=Pseudoalteromonas tunicata D2 TaxID=87626 RepID=A4CBC7_9GAMM|nr:aminotransferase class V-fold PLP-dependent enzyme [Pseudoalteromonas tunicata]AXT29977.1 aminotransferase class V-fold PLP-dependent enzyme [Pseudoalteromonas tunicata]EAR27664.1 putative enzyme of the cysteine desulfurase family, metallo-beta-lactamase superfamily protein [Pseudoalteromonas tunicata D2]